MYSLSLPLSLSLSLASSPTSLPSLPLSLSLSPILSLLLSLSACLADLAVDWINDKLYWTDRDLRKIEEYDLSTAQRRIVQEMDVGSTPLGLAVYPLEGSG